MPCVSNSFIPVAEWPDDCQQISTAWLSAALGLEVTSFKTRSCSGGRVAITVVLHDILYAAAVEPAHKARLPSSLAIKMHPATAEARQFFLVDLGLQLRNDTRTTEAAIQQLLHQAALLGAPLRHL